MKKLLVILFLLAFSSALVDVDNYNVKSKFRMGEYVDGIVNLTISEEDYDKVIVFNSGEGIELGKFLDENDADFDCSPLSCSSSYDFSSEDDNKTVSLSRFETKYAGFVLFGEDVYLNGMDFKVASDFDSDIRQPLTIEFFEKEEWKFAEFSDEFLPKKWGCFDPWNKTEWLRIQSGFSYCELLSISDASQLKLGADISVAASDKGDVDMTIYFDDRNPKSCSFTPSKGEDSCIITAPTNDLFVTGSYKVCITSREDTEYNIYKDDTGESCGYTYIKGGSWASKDIDYSIFIQNVEYANANEMGIINFKDKYEHTSTADDIILDKYDRNCSKGCILPLKIFGIAQNFRLYDVALKYSTLDGPAEDNHLVYDLDVRPAKVDFDGELNLSFLGLEVNHSGEYFAKLSGEYLFKKNIEAMPVPVISSVLPANAPAGVPVVFYVFVDFDENASFTYSWDFGDETLEKTNVAYVTHTYKDLGDYEISVKVVANGDLSSEKSFDVDVISPESAVGVGIKARRSALKNIRESIGKASNWYDIGLIKFLEIAKFESELDGLEEEKNNSFDAEDFIGVVIKIYDMNVPVLVWENYFETPYLLSDLGDVNIDAIAKVTGETVSGSNEDYASSILAWQNENIDVVMKGEEVLASYWDDSSKSVLTTYTLDLTNNWKDSSYLVINAPLDELFFNGDVEAHDVNDSVVIELASGEKKTVEFYCNAKYGDSFFVSPALSYFVIEASINTDCNFNKVCEEEYGENSDNCRSDCKPIKKAAMFFAIGLFVFLIIYTVLQIWYKKNYENYLFKDRAQLYNLVMFVTNARAGDIGDDNIAEKLEKQGWTKERVDYVIRKSLGKSVGMVEILPIERISAWLRARKARKAAARPVRAATGFQQHMNNNINKSGMGVRGT